MIKIIISSAILLLTWALKTNAQGTLENGHYVACGDSKVLIIDPEKSTGPMAAVIWEWDAQVAADIPVEYKKLLLSLDECKPVLNNSKILVCSSSGATLLIDVKTKAVEFYAKTPMAHSAALLPGGRIAVANSTHKNGNSLELYEIGKSEMRIYSDTLYSGHGALWDEPSKRLYVLGYNRLKAYTLENWDTETPSLRLENTWLLPNAGGHDLSYGKDRTLLVTVHHSTYNFDIATEQFTEFAPLQGKENIKSLNYNTQENDYIYTIAEESWWTENIYHTQSDKTISLPGLRLYKVRIAH
ncbi:MAG: DUF6528 family protein [Sphingobacterium sp.]